MSRIPEDGRFQFNTHSALSKVSIIVLKWVYVESYDAYIHNITSLFILPYSAGNETMHLE